MFYTQYSMVSQGLVKFFVSFFGNKDTAGTVPKYGGTDKRQIEDKSQTYEREHDNGTHRTHQIWGMECKSFI